MENIHNTLTLISAIMEIIFYIIGFALIFKWWNRLVLLDAKVNFLFEQENERFMLARGMKPKYNPIYTDNLYEKAIKDGRIDPDKVSILDFYTKSILLTPDFSSKGDDVVIEKLPGRKKSPPPPPPPPPAKGNDSF
jgi:hypothetical protein